jgi:hypothetical protein
VTDYEKNSVYETHLRALSRRTCFAGIVLWLATDGLQESTIVPYRGPSGKDLIVSDDPVQDQKHRGVPADPANPAEAFLPIGADAAQFPILCLRKTGDDRLIRNRARRNLLTRQIGSNELDTVPVCCEYADKAGASIVSS